MTNTMQSDIESGGSAADLASTATDRAADVRDVAGEQAKAVAQDAAAHAQRLVHETSQQLRTQASAQTDRLTETLREVAEQLRSMTDGRGTPPGFVTDLTHQLAATASRAAARLEAGGLDSLVDDTKRFARNRPAVFVAAAAGAGFVLGQRREGGEHPRHDRRREAVGRRSWLRRRQPRGRRRPFPRVSAE